MIKYSKECINILYNLYKTDANISQIIIDNIDYLESILSEVDNGFLTIGKNDAWTKAMDNQYQNEKFNIYKKYKH